MKNFPHSYGLKVRNRAGIRIPQGQIHVSPIVWPFKCRLRYGGFTLVEVMVALLLLSGSLMGMAALQSNSLAENVGALNRSIATQFSYDLADRMRANPLGINTYTTIAPASATAVSDCLSTTGCSVAAMAQNDLYEWNRDLTAAIPSAVGSINVVGGVYTLTIRWDDNHDGVLDANDVGFQTSFRL